MTFLDEHPNYNTYESKIFYVKDFPDDIEEAMQGLLMNLAQGDSRNLKFLVNKIATVVNSGITENYSWDYLIPDLNHGIRKLIKSSYNNFFDFLELLWDEDWLSSKEINSFLEKNSIGYEFLRELNSHTWVLKEECGVSVIERAETLLHTPNNPCQQAKEHLRQIINNLNTGTDRAKKDALRDGLSALEALIRQITQTNDIKDATSQLRNLKIAPDFLIKDGLSIWDKIHQQYPDVRHGNPQTAQIGNAELIYCLNKILIYIEFLCDLNIK